MIIKRILESKENIFYTDDAWFFYDNNFDDSFGNALKLLDFNKASTVINELEENIIEIVNILEETRGENIEHFVFDLTGDYSVIIYEKINANKDFKSKIKDIDKYPILKSCFSNNINDNISDCSLRIVALLRLSYESKVLSIYSYKGKQTNSGLLEYNGNFPKLSLDKLNNINYDDLCQFLKLNKLYKETILKTFESDGEYITFDYNHNILLLFSDYGFESFSYLSDDIEYFSNGQIKLKTFNYPLDNEFGLTHNHFKDYKLCVEYYPNGNLASVCKYNLVFFDKTLEDDFVTYYSDGSVKVKGNYLKGGKKNGVWKEYHPNKTLKLSGEYKRCGGEINYEEIWDEETNKNVVEMVRDPYYTEKDGKWIEYYENGKIKSIESYSKGKLLDKQEYND